MRRSPFRHASSSFFSAIVAIVASSGSEACRPHDSTERCVPGATAPCRCPSGPDGVHVCGSDGYFELCTCTADDGGSNDIGTLVDGASIDSGDRSDDAQGGDGELTDGLSSDGPPGSDPRCRFCANATSSVTIHYSCVTTDPSDTFPCSGEGTLTFAPSTFSRYGWVPRAPSGALIIDNFMTPSGQVPYSPFGMTVEGYSPYSGALDNESAAGCEAHASTGRPFVDGTVTDFPSSDGNTLFGVTCTRTDGSTVPEEVRVRRPTQAWFCSECHGDDRNGDAGHYGMASLMGGFSGEFETDAMSDEPPSLHCRYTGTFFVYTRDIRQDYCL